MPTNKEDVYSALYTRLSGSVTGLRTVSRKLRHFDAVDPSEQPAMFVHQTGVESAAEAGRPAKQIVKADIYIYVYEDGENGPYPTMNSLVHQVEMALERKAQDPLSHAQGNTTLAKVVTTARLTGIEYGGGTLGEQGVAIISLEMVLPS